MTAPAFTDTALEWADVRADAIEQFRGELPHPETEQAIIAVFVQHPARVLHAIPVVAQAAGLRSCWATLRYRLTDHGPVAQATVSVGKRDRDEAARWAENWINSAGLHYDRESEVVDELFGRYGALKHHAGDETLIEHVIAYWRSKRPLGEAGAI